MARRRPAAVVFRVAIMVVALGLVACGSADGDATSDGGGGMARGSTAPTSTAPLPSAPPASVAPSAPMPAAPAFDSSVAPVDAADLPASWRPGCPVPPEELRRVTIRHWGFDDAVHQGELVVHVDAVDAIEGVFRSLFDARFPLERVELVDRYDGDDDRSMAANNTSAFNCREIAGRPGVWSEHAYGRAVDLNPVQNPNVSSSGRVEPPAGTAFTDRDPAAPGLIRADGPAVTGFDAVGWSWGGNWSSSKDYQHFSATGR